MKSVALFCIGSVVFIILFAGCKKEETTQSVQETFTGILATDANCLFIGGDTTDFLPRPTGGGPGSIPTNYSLIRACPNPVMGDTTTISFQIPLADSVIIQVIPRPNAAPIAVLYNQQTLAGVYNIRWGFNGPSGIYRVQMITARGFTSYGDVEFK